MEGIKIEIEKHKAKLYNLIKTRKDLSDKNEILSLNNEIISEQEFINSLLTISNELLNKKESDTIQKQTNFDKVEKKDTKIETDKEYDLKKGNNLKYLNEDKESNNYKHIKINKKTKNYKDTYDNNIKLEENKAKRSKTTESKNYKVINIDESINPYEVKNFSYYHNDEDILTKYNRQIINKNTIYFTCYKKRNGCHGNIKYKVKNKNWYLLHE